MSKIERLMQELCPEGVPTRTIHELFEYEQPTPYLVATTNYVESGTPVLTAGQTFVLGYTNEAEGIYEASERNPVIIFDDFTTAFKWVDFRFKAKSSAMKMIRAQSGSRAELRYLFYWMGDRDFKPGEHARHWISLYSKLEIPWPPLEVQKEIVSILDKFTQLEAELEAELEARRTQYEVTRDRLLDFSSDLSSHPLSKVILKLCPQGVPFGELSDVTLLDAGDRVTKANMTNQGQFDVYGAGTVPTGKLDHWNRENALIFSRAGAGAGFVNFIPAKFWATDVCFVAEQKPAGPLIKFVYYWMKSRQHELMRQTYGGSMPKIDKLYLWKHQVPLPSLEIQKEIISILDKFDALVNDLTMGLPAEIAARRKQYEYYRNTLLTFKELDAA